MEHRVGRWCLDAAGCLAAVGCLALSGCAAPRGPEGLPATPHPVIVVAVDGLRADALGCYGATGAAATPGIDALAAESVRFEWAFAQSADPTVSFASVLSGLYPTTSGVISAGDVLPDEADTLAERAAGAGMVTAGFVEGAAAGDAFGLGQGFAHFEWAPDPGSGARAWVDEHAGETFLLVVRGWTVGSPFSVGVTAGGAVPPEGFAERLQEFLLQGAESDASILTEDDVAYARAVYADRVAAIDGRIGALVARLSELGLLERATLVVLGTRGLDLHQHGSAGNQTLHSTVTRVPLLIRFPGGAKVATVDRIVELVDLMPTLLDLVGAETPGAAQGSSLLPLIRGEGRPPYVAFSETTERGGQQAVALGGWRLLHDIVDGDSRLYGLSLDPLELDDQAAAQPDKAAVMVRHIQDWQRMVAAASLDPELKSEEPLDDATLERLKSLGYIH